MSLALVVGLSGCRASGVAANDFLTWGSRSFAPNPVANVPFHAGLALGFIAGLPLALISWPLTAAFYPEEDEGEFYLSSALAPAVLLGTFLGTVLAAPVSPFGLPWVPEEPDPAPGAPTVGPALETGVESPVESATSPAAAAPVEGEAPASDPEAAGE